jgi:hypothetical protein
MYLLELDLMCGVSGFGTDAGLRATTTMPMGINVASLTAQ